MHTLVIFASAPYLAWRHLRFVKQSLFRRLYRSLLGHPVARWFVILGSIAYLLSPLDISPDVFPIVGWIDDGLLATLVVTGLTEIVLERRRDLKAQKAERKTAGPDTNAIDTVATSVDDHT
ncbi:MAG: YkvA family protein [Leptolyngbyaceae cyanobacterium]